MNPKTRRAALEAAARVALGALSVTSLASCGGKTVGDFSLDTESTETGAPTPRAEPVAEAGAPEPLPKAMPTPSPPRAYDGGVVAPPVVVEDAGSGLACVGPVALSHEPQPAISDDAFGCCVAYLAAHFPGDAGADPSLSNCCHAVIVGVDQDAARYNQAGTRFDCCSASDPELQSELWGHWLCTPWGPPVPPSLDAHLFGVA